MKSSFLAFILFLLLSVPSSDAQPSSADVDLDACGADLVAADGNGSGAVDLQEYLVFVNRYAGRRCVPPVSALSLPQRAAFTSLACQCQWTTAGDGAACCLHGNAALPTAGAVLETAAQRSEEQFLFLTVVCVVTEQTLPSACPTAAGADADPDPLVQPTDAYLQEDNRVALLETVGNNDDDDDDDTIPWWWWVVLAAAIAVCCWIVCLCGRSPQKNKKKTAPQKQTDPKLMPPTKKAYDDDGSDTFSDHHPTPPPQLTVPTVPTPPQNEPDDEESKQESKFTDAWNPLETAVHTIPSMEDDDDDEGHATEDLASLPSMDNNNNSAHDRSEDGHSLLIYSAHDRSEASSSVDEAKEEMHILGLAKDEEEESKEPEEEESTTTSTSKHSESLPAAIQEYDGTAAEIQPLVVGDPWGDRAAERKMPGTTQKPPPRKRKKKPPKRSKKPREPPPPVVATTESTATTTTTTTNSPTMDLWEALDNPEDSTNHSAQTPTTTTEEVKQPETPIPKKPSRGYSTRLDELQHQEPEMDPPVDKKKKSVSNDDDDSTKGESESTAIEDGPVEEDNVTFNFDWILESLS